MEAPKSEGLLQLLRPSGDPHFDAMALAVVKEKLAETGAGSTVLAPAKQKEGS